LLGIVRGNLPRTRNFYDFGKKQGRKNFFQRAIKTRGFVECIGFSDRSTAQITAVSYYNRNRRRWEGANSSDAIFLFVFFSSEGRFIPFGRLRRGVFCVQ
jgi:hypothetical protein